MYVFIQDLPNVSKQSCKVLEFVLPAACSNALPKKLKYNIEYILKTSSCQIADVNPYIYWLKLHQAKWHLLVGLNVTFFNQGVSVAHYQNFSGAKQKFSANSEIFKEN